MALKMDTFFLSELPTEDHNRNQSELVGELYSVWLELSRDDDLSDEHYSPISEWIKIGHGCYQRKRCASAE